MAVSNAAYRIIKRAAIIRIQQGETIEEVVASYNKLSSEQQEQLLNELTEYFAPPADIEE